MISLSATSSSVIFTFQDNPHYLQNGTIEVPKNSLTLVTDDSAMATFKKSASNDIFVSALYSELGMSKSELESWFKENAVGGGGDITSGEVQTMIDESISGKADSVSAVSSAEYVSSSTTINFKNVEGTVISSIDASDFVIDGMIDDVRIETISGVSYLVIDFNTASGKEDIQIPLTDIFDPSNYYTKTEIDQSLSGKQDTLIEGRAIDITNNTVSLDLAISAGTGTNSIIEGSATAASGQNAHAEGDRTQALGNHSHAEGQRTIARGNYSHAEGAGSEANGNFAHAEGRYTSANTQCSHTEGRQTITNNESEHASGQFNVSTSASTTFGDSGNTLFSVGNGASENTRHNAFEIRQNGDIYLNDGSKLQDNLFSGSYNDLTDKPTIPTVPTSNTAFTNDAGYITEDAISGKADSSAVTEEISAAVSGKADTSAVTASINAAVSGKQDTLIEGRAIDITNNTVSLDLPISAGTGTNSIREGHSGNTASGDCSHAEGYDTVASGGYSHAEGMSTTANGWRSHAEGGGTMAIGGNSHAEGNYTTASGSNSHAEGSSTVALGNNSHAEGYSTSATSQGSHAEGWYTIANNQSEHASGQFNVSSSGSSTFGDSGNTLFSVGNGTADNARHNAFEIRQNGDIYLSLNGQDVKLQDQLGGGSITIDPSLDSGSTNAVANSAITTAIEAVSGAIPTVTSAVTSGDTNAVAGGAVYDKFDEVEQVTARALVDVNEKFGGLKLEKLTQAQYDALSGSTDSNTLYVIVN